VTSIYLIRHAECEGNVIKALSGRTDFKLTKTGREMSIALLNELKQHKIDKIYSSPLSRCIDTMKPTAEHFKLKINICNNLIEKDFGIYDGMKWEEVEKINPQIIENKNKLNEITGIEGQETTQKVLERMKQCMKKIAEDNDGKRVVVCSHGCAIIAFLKEIKGVSLTEQKEKYEQNNACINFLEYNKGKFNIIKINGTDHLQTI